MFIGSKIRNEKQKSKKKTLKLYKTSKKNFPCHNCELLIFRLA